MESLKKLFGFVLAPLKAQFEFSINQKKLAEFVVWLLTAIPPEKIAEKLDPVFEGKAMFEKIDAMVLKEAIQGVKNWAQDKLKE